MFIPRECVSGPDQGKWYMMATVPGSEPRRAGYCSYGCAGHDTRRGAVEHYLQYQLDRESGLWIERRGPLLDCEICGAPTTLRARLGRSARLFVLCTRHQSSISLRELFWRKLEPGFDSDGAQARSGASTVK